MTGFVYVWFDRKHHRFYIGSHWGDEKDNYVCSSRWMKRAYKRRKWDFRRRIVARVSESRELLYAEEQRWLNMIDPVLLGSRYYNLSLRTKGGSGKDSEQTRLKKSLAKKGKPPNNKLSTSSKPEVRAKIEVGLKKYWESRIKPKKQKLQNFKGPRPEQSERLKGQNNPMYGRKDAADHLNTKNFECSKCGKITTKGNWVRWHEINCRN